MKFDGKDVEEAQQFPTQQEDRKKDNKNGHQFAEGQTTTVGLDSAGGQAENIERGKAEDHGPKNVVNVVATVGMPLQD